MSEEKVIRLYNARGANERNFDMQHNDFGWAHLPFLFINENTVFMLLMAMAKNFYLYLAELLSRLGMKGLKPTLRVKRLVFTFVTVAAKWVRTARTWILNIYTHRTCYKKFSGQT